MKLHNHNIDVFFTINDIMFVSSSLCVEIQNQSIHIEAVCVGEVWSVDCNQEAGVVSTASEMYGSDQDWWS